jgi:pre-mRNA-processing factor 40
VEADASHGWSEMTDPLGRKYYGNAKTGVTTWVKPEALVKEEEAKAAAGAGTPSNANDGVTKKGRQLGGWTEYAMPNGRFYYYNTSTKRTQWQKPSEFKAEEDAVTAAPTGSAA